jgi:tetratricopeptide (TPR) repeat protein
MAKYTRFPRILALALAFLPVFAYAQNDDTDLAPRVATSQEQTEAPSPPPAIIKNGTVGSYLSGQFARGSGDVENAIRYLKRAHTNDPQNTEVSLQLQGLLLVNGGIEEAVMLARTLPQDSQKDSLTLLLLCLDAAKRNDLEEAKKILDEAALVSVGQLWLPLVSAWVEVGRHNLPKPMQLEGLSADTSHASALANYHLALINAQAGFAEAAIENFKKAVIDASNPPARVMMMMSKFYDENKQPPALASLVNAWRKNNADAEIVTEDITSSFTPQDGIAEVLFTMGNVVQNAGAPQDAIIYLNMAHYVKPEFPLVTISLGDAYSDLRQFIKANAIYATVKEKSPFYGRAQLRMAMNENQVGRWENALAMLDALSKKLPTQYEPLVAKGDLLRTRQHFPEAVETYTQALARIPKIESYHWPIYFARGVCQERQNKWAEAETDLKQALKLRPEQPDVMNYLGYSWLMQHENLEEARAMIEKASALRPNDPQIADSMGWALYLLAKYEEAAPYIEKALESLPTDPTINDHLGDVYWKLGRKTEARYQWERSLTFSPEPEDASAIQRKLKEGLADGESQVKPPVVAESRSAVSVQ